MYVRWKNRARTRNHKPTGDITLTAVLVRSERGNWERGQRVMTPRQHIISYLGSIRQSLMPWAFHRAEFWRSVETHLDALTLPPERRAAIMADIEKVVPRPTPEDTQQDIEQIRRIEAAIERR